MALKGEVLISRGPFSRKDWGQGRAVPMPHFGLDDTASLRLGVLLVVLSLQGDSGDNAGVARAEQSREKELRAGLCPLDTDGSISTRVHGARGSGWMQGWMDGMDGDGWDGWVLPRGQGWRGWLWELCVCTQVWGLPGGVWMCLEARPLLAGMLWVPAAPALPPAWHWALPMHGDPWRPSPPAWLERLSHEIGLGGLRLLSLETLEHLERDF